MKKDNFKPRKQTKEDILNSDDFADWMYNRWQEDEPELEFMCKHIFGSTAKAIKEYKEWTNE